VVRCASLSILLIASAATGGGRIEAARPLRMVDCRIDAEIRERLARVTVTETFRNEHDCDLDGFYAYPLPEGAILVESTTSLDGGPANRVDISTQALGAISEGIVLASAERDPLGLRPWQVRIDRFPAGGRWGVRSVYVQFLEEQGDQVEWRVPLRHEALNGPAIGALHVDARIECEGAILSISSPSGTVERTGERSLRLRYEVEDVAPREDLVVRFTRTRDPSGITVLSSLPPGAEGTLLAFVKPPAREVPKDLLLMLDTGSRWEPIDEQDFRVARREVARALATLRPIDRFALLDGPVGGEARACTLRPATAEARAEAIRMLDARRAGDAIPLGTGLERACLSMDPDRLTFVVALGVPGIALNALPDLRQAIATLDRLNARLWVVGSRHGQALDRAVADLRGTRVHIETGVDLERTAARLFRRIAEPQCTDIAIDFGRPVSAIRPAELPDLFAGETLLLLARYRPPGPLSITLRASGGTLVREAVLSDDDDLPWLHGLWERAEVAHLRRQQGSLETKRPAIGPDRAWRSREVEMRLRWLADRAPERWGDSAARVLLAFLNEGYTDRGDGFENPYAGFVRDRLRALMARQQESGRIGSDLSEHAIATLALAKAWWMTHNPRYIKPVRDACAWIASSEDRCEILTTCRLIHALHTAAFGGIEIDPAALGRLRRSLDDARDPTPTESAAILFARVVLGEDPRRSDGLGPLVERCLAALPTSDPDLLYWGSLALSKVGGPAWRDWAAAMGNALAMGTLPDDSIATRATFALCTSLRDRPGRLRLR